MNKVASLGESSRVAMSGEDGRSKINLNEDTLGIGRMARNVLSETMSRRPQYTQVKSLATVLNHLSAKEEAEAHDSDPMEPALIRRSATWAP